MWLNTDNTSQIYEAEQNLQGSLEVQKASLMESALVLKSVINPEDQAEIEQATEDIEAQYRELAEVISQLRESTEKQNKAAKKYLRQIDQCEAKLQLEERRLDSQRPLQLDTAGCLQQLEEVKNLRHQLEPLAVQVELTNQLKHELVRLVNEKDNKKVVEQRVKKLNNRFFVAF